MNLKEECVDMLHVIIDPLLEEKDPDDFPSYEILPDSKRNFCQRSSEDITYGYTCDCESEKECSNSCPYYQDRKIDVFVENYDSGECFYYLFGDTPSVSKGTVIRNREQLKKEMIQFRNKLERWKNEDAKLGKRYVELKEYAKSFAIKVKKEYPDLFTLIDTDILPISFESSAGEEVQIAGVNQICLNQNDIKIFYTTVLDEDNLCRTIRHELLHYMLYTAGIQYDDDCAVFHYFCKIYDANAYQEMSVEEKVKYDLLMKGVERIKQSNLADAPLQYGIEALIRYIGCDVPSKEKETAFMENVQKKVTSMTTLGKNLCTYALI